MGTPRLFKYYLQDANGQYYYVDNEGNVQLSETEKALQYSPKNWDKIKRKYGRDLKNWGIMRSTTVPFEFEEDGAKILRSIYYKDGLANYDAYCKLTIKKRNDGAIRTWQHDIWFTTEIDFATQPDDGVDENGNFFKVLLSDRSLAEIIADIMDKEVEVPLDANYHSIVLDGFPLTGTYKWLSGGTGSAVTIRSGGNPTAEYYVFPMGLAQDTNDYFSRLFFAQNQGSYIDSLNDTPADSNRFTAVEDSVTTEYTISGSIDVNNVGGATGLRLQIQLLRKDMVANTNNYTLLFQSGSDIVGSQTVSVTASGNTTFSGSTNSYYLVIRLGASSEQNVEIIVNSFTYTVQFTTTPGTTTCRAYRYDVAVQKLVDIASGGQTGVTSNLLSQTVPLANLSQSYYFNSLPKNEFLTCGDAIRGVSNPIIKTTLGDVLKDLWSRWMAGSSTHSGFRIERLDYFFNDNVTIGTINKIRNFKKTTATDLIYNQISTGFDSNNNDDKLNGKYDFAAKQQYKLPAKRVIEEADLTTPFMASPFEIERIRGDLAGKDTTSDNADNRVFLLSAYDNSGTFNLIKHTGDVNGFLTDEMPNLAFRPHYNVLRHIPYLRSIMNVKQGVDGTKIATFESGERYTSFFTYIDDIYIPEDGDVVVGSQQNGYHPSKLFIPVYFTFDCEPENGFMTAIENNPFGKIDFYDEITESWYSGFVMDVEIAPDEIDVYSMKLLCAPNVDVQNLIY